MPKESLDPPRAALKEAIGGARAVGTVQIGFGLFGVVMLSPMAFYRGWQEHAAFYSAVIFQLTPGVMQYVIASMLKRHELRAARWCIRMMLGECAAVLLAVTFWFFWPNAYFLPLLWATAFDIFLLPAMIVQMWKIHAASRAIRLLPSVGSGFEMHTPVGPVPVEMVSEQDII